MDDARKTKAQLIEELHALRQRLAEPDTNGALVTGRGSDLQQSDERFARIFHISPAALLLTRMEDGTFLDVNERFCDICGYTRDELIGQGAVALGMWADPDDRKAMVQRLRSEGRVLNLETTFRSRSGEIRSGLVSAERVEVGGQQCILSACLDITDRKRAEQALLEREQTLTDLFDSANDLIISVQPDGRLIFANRAWRERLGYPQDQIGRMLLFDVLHPESKSHCMAMFEKVLKEGQISNTEAVLLASDGRRIVVEGNCSCRYIDGKPVSIRGIFRDITDRRKAQDALHESQRALSTLMSNLPGMAYRCRNDADWTMEFVSDGCYSLTGYKPHELVNNKVLAYADLIHEDDRQNVWEVVQRAVIRRDPFHLLYRIITAQGQSKWVWEQGRGVFSEGGSLVALEGFINDITEQKHAQEQLLKERDFSNTLIEASPFFFVAIGIDGKTLMMNREMLRALGYTREEVIGRDYLNTFVPARERESLAGIFQRLRTSNKPTLNQNHVLTREGRELLIEWRGGSVFGDDNAPEYFFGTGIDVTERTRNQKIQSVLFHISQAGNATPTLDELLRTIHQELGELIDATNFYVALYDAKTETYRFPYCVDALDRDREFSPQQLRRSLTDYVRRTGKPMLVDEESHRKLVESGEVDRIGADSHVWLGAPLKGGRGPIGVVVVQSYQARSVYSEQDLELLAIVAETISSAIDRRRAAEELAASEKRYRELVETSNDLIWTLDLTGHLTFVNQASRRVYGYEPEEMIGRLFTDFETPEQAAKDLETFRQILAGRQYYQYETRHQRKDGTQVVLSINAIAARDEQGQVIGAAGTASDISARVHAEKALRRSERLAALGTTVAGVAHELNNPLTSIFGLSALLAKNEKLGDEARSLAMEIAEQGRRCAKIVEDLLGFARPRKVVRRSVFVNNLLDESLRLARRYARLSNVEIETDYDSSIPPILVDPHLLQQVFINIINNAADALKAPGSGGSMAIRTWRDHDTVCIEFTDTGPGIADPSRVFDPFYSTKETGQGTGLGLSLSYGIIEEHGGSISAHNAEKGAQFVVRLPVDLPEDAPEEPAPSARVQRGG